MELTIPKRFCGPSSSGNGGWTSGSLAAALRTTGVAGPVTVRLSAPPPLDRSLGIDITAEPSARLFDGDTTIAVASPSQAWTDEPPAAVDVDVASAAAAAYIDPQRHPFPDCFACGPAADEGLRLTPGHTDATHTACLWRPADVADNDLAEPWLWSALDCPGGWASDLEDRPMVLGTMTAEIFSRPQPQVAHVITGRLDRQSGRRSWTSSAIWSPQGDLVARANAVWVQIDAALFNAIHA